MTTIEELAAFTAATGAGDVPTDVRDYTALVLLDCVVSAIGASGLERSEMSVALAERFGASDDASVLGSPQRSSVLGAAYVNADLMNVLDADETFFNGAHFAAMSFAPAIAEAEKLDASGRDLLTAAAVSFDISARLNIGTSLMEYDGETFRFSKLSSHGYASLGAAAAIGCLNGVSAGGVADAFGLATWLAPTAKNNYMSSRRRFNSLKYSPNGGIATAGMMAAYMAMEGFEGDADTLDTEPGFFEAQGYIGGDRAAITADLGSKWWILETSIKPYPACRFSHAAIDAVRNLVAEQGITPDEVTGVEVLLGPAAYSISQFREPLAEIPVDHVAPYAGQFHMPHLVAVSLAGIPPGPGWFSRETLTDPRIRELTGRVRVAEDTELNTEWHDTITAGPGGKVRHTRGAITVETTGETFVVEQDYAMGDPWSDETRMTWDAIRTKAHTFCDHLMAPARVDALVDGFANLDEVPNVRAALADLLRLGD